jgi:hypothetical protein
VCVCVCVYYLCVFARAREYSLFTHMEIFSHKHTRAQRELTREREGGRHREGHIETGSAREREREGLGGE